MFFAIPFFKNALYLKETLFSLLDQTDGDWQAFVLDDSIANEEVLEAIAIVDQIGDPRISYRKNEKNLGMAENWNQAFDLAKDSEFLVILHADDRLKPDYVQAMKSFAKANPKASAYFCKCLIIGSDGKPVFSLADLYKKWVTPNEPVLMLDGVKGIQKLIRGDFIFCPSVCYRTRDFSTMRFKTNFKMVTDFDFILRSLLSGQTWMGYYDHPLFEYRRHSENTTVNLTQSLVRFHEEINLYRKLGNDLETLGENEIARSAKKMTMVKLNLLFEMAKALVTFRFGSFFAKAKLLWEIA